MGYVLRLAETNHCESANWILLAAGLKPLGRYASWRSYCRSYVDYSRFAELAGLSAAELEALLAPVRLGGAPAPDEIHRGLGVPAELMRYRHPRVCPRCLAESGYCKIIWDVRPVTACVEHRRLLLSRCPGCGETLCWNRPGVARCRCGQNLAAGEYSESSGAFTLNAAEALQHAYRGVDSSRTGAPLGDLGFGGLCRALATLAAFPRVASDLDEAAPGLEEHNSVEAAAAALTNWPESFHEFAHAVVAEGRVRELADAFDRLPADAGLTFLQVALDDLRFGSRDSARPLPWFPERFVVANEAHKRARMSREAFDVLLEAGVFAVHWGASGRRFVPAEPMWTTRYIYAHEVLSTEQAAAVLEVRRPAVDQLVSSGALPLARDLATDPRPGVSLGGLARFVQRLTARCEVVRDGEPALADLLTFEDALSRLRSGRIDPAPWLESILAAESAAFLRVPREHAPPLSLAPIAILWWELSEYIRSRGAELRIRRKRVPSDPRTFVTIAVKRLRDHQVRRRVAAAEAAADLTRWDLASAAWFVFRRTGRAP